ncbi:hypothetical protein EMCRGX_G032242 [Ephydatia muelleri]
MKSSCVCIECGAPNKQLYRMFEGGAIQLSQCERCKEVADKYAYRHLIYNHRLSTWLLTVFAVVLLFCEAYAKLKTSALNSADSILVQIHFHTLLLQSSIEFLIAVGGTYCIVVHTVTTPRVSASDIFKTLIISSFGKLSSVSALIWNEDFYPWISMATVLPAQTQACRAVLNIGLLSATVLVAMQSGLVLMASYTLSNWRVALIELWYHNLFT